MTVTPSYLVETYGYFAILLGTFLEGETILILGGIAAKLGYLKLPWVIGCAFIGSLAGDQLFFFLGRYRGQSFLARRPNWQRRADKVHRIMERHRVPIIIGFRFLYGVRAITPFVIGMSRVPVLEFILLNLIGAGLWSVAISLAGYAFGHGLELMLGNLQHYELTLLLFILFIAGLAWVIRYLILKRQINKTRQ